MTHDELLALINDEIEVCEPECNQHQQINAPWLALRAVVELHKPFTNHFNIIICSLCINSKIIKEHFYPCSTIQAIERKLT